MSKVQKIGNKKKTIIIIAVILVLLSAVFLVDTYRFGFGLPKTSSQISAVNNVAIGARGNKFVLNNSGYEVLRINEKGKVDLIISGGSDSERGYSCARAVTEDNDGNIYIHDVIPSDEAVSWYGRERIVKFDKWGRYSKTVYDDTYDIPSLRYHIMSLQCTDGVVYAIKGTDYGLQLLDVNASSPRNFPFEGGEVSLSCVTYNKADDSIYACRKNGDMLRIRGGYEVLFENADSEVGGDFFGSISIDPEGRIMFCGVNTGVIHVYENGEITYAFLDQVEATTMDCSNGYLFNEYYDIAMADSFNGSVDVYDSLSYSPEVTAIFIGQIIAWLILAAAAGYIIFRALKAILKSSSRVRSIFVIAIVIAAASIGFCAYVYNELQTISKDDMVEREILCARLVDEAVSGKDFLSIQGVDDFRSDAYMEIKENTDRIILDDGISAGDLYLMMYTVEDDVLYVRYSTEESYGCEYYYDVINENVKAALAADEYYVQSESREINGIFQSTFYPKHDETGNVIGVIEVGTDLTFLEKRIKDGLTSLFLSIIALGVVFVLIILEIIELKDSSKEISKEEIITGRKPIPVSMYRFIVFIIFFATNITTPFLSIYALSISETTGIFSAFSPEIQAAIPISAEVFSGAIFSFLGGGIIDRLGTRKAGILGSAIFFGGLAIRFLYPSIAILTLGNLIQGAGWGIFLLIVNARIAGEPDDAEREKGFTNYTIGLQNGINSGVVFGGFLLGISSYKVVFAVAAVLSLGVLVFVMIYVFNTNADVAAATEENAEKTSNAKAYLKFLLSPRVIVYFLMIIIPVISASYYLNYMYPLVADSIGMAEDMIGYSFLLNGLVMICFGNLLVRYASKFFHRSTQLMLSSIVYTVMFAMVGFFQSTATLLISLVLMAITCSVGQVAQTTFYSDLKETEELGYERAMGVYSLFENLAQTCGSFIFGYILNIGITAGLTVYGIIIGICGVIFAVVVKRCNRKEHRGLVK